MLLQYWEKVASENPHSDLAKTMISRIKRDNPGRYERNSAATALIEAGHLSTLEQVALGCPDMPPEEVFESVEQMDGEEAEQKAPERFLRGSETTELEEALLNEAVSKGILADSYRPHGKVKYSDIKRDFGVIKAFNDGNCLPHALTLAIPTMYMKASEQYCTKMRNKLSSYFRTHGFILNSASPEDAESDTRFIPGVAQLNEHNVDVDGYKSATTVNKFADIIANKKSLQGETFLNCAAMAGNFRVVVFRCLDPLAATQEECEYEVEMYGRAPFEKSGLFFLILSGVHYNALITKAEAARRVDENIRSTEELAMPENPRKGKQPREEIGKKGKALNKVARKSKRKRPNHKK